MYIYSILFFKGMLVYVNMDWEWEALGKLLLKQNCKQFSLKFDELHPAECC